MERTITSDPAGDNRRAVLFSSAGRRVELIHCFRQAAAELNVPLRTIAVDIDPAMSSACRAADESVAVPRCLAPEFVPSLLRICERRRVDLVVPTIDTELEILAAHRDQFCRIGTRISVPSLEITRVARNKAATASFLAAAGIQTPRTGTIDELLQAPDSWRWPVILKPLGGSSSLGLVVAPTLAAAEYAQIDRNDYVAQELWRGAEYTVNCFFDAGGTMRCAVPHRRYEMRAGEVSKGITQRLPILSAFSEALGKALHGQAFGALCFQAIVRESGEAAVFEINARFGGGYPLAHRAGANFARWLLEETSAVPSSATNEWREGVIMLRYDAAVFVEPDQSAPA